MWVCRFEFLGLCFGTGGGRFLVDIGTSGGCMRERRKQAQQREKASRREGESQRQKIEKFFFYLWLATCGVSLIIVKSFGLLW